MNWILTQRFESLKKVSHLQIPVLFIHGTDDEIIPVEMSRQLFQASPEPKRLLLVFQANYLDIGKIGDAQYLAAIQEFSWKNTFLVRG